MLKVEQTMDIKELRAEGHSTFNRGGSFLCDHKWVSFK